MNASTVPFDRLDTIRKQIEERLEDAFDHPSPTEVLRAARYLVLGGGHRWRGLLAVAAGWVFDPHAERVVLPLAGALEILHAASLALDDLPSMDNAQTRRGKPCLHLVFPKWASDMVPAFLINTAYRVYASNPAASDERIVRGILLLGEMGANLAWGQELDLMLSRSDVAEETLLECYTLKSGALFAAALAGAGILCGAAPDQVAALRECGFTLGQAYQYLDDLTDDSNTSGSNGTGAEGHGKVTAVARLGLLGTRDRATQLLGEALRSLDPLGASATPLRELIDRICRQG